MVAHWQLRAGGMSRAGIASLRDQALLTNQSRGVYLGAGAPFTYRASLWVAVLATRGVLGFATAAHLWGVADAPAPRVEVVIDPARRVVAPPHVRIHRVFVARSWVVTRDGLPVTSRAMTVLDHAGRLSPRDAARLIDRALQREWITLGDLDARLRDYAGRQGNAQLRVLRNQASDGAAAESERKLHRILRQAGLTGWKPNYPIWSEGRLVAVVDVALVSKRVALEIDGWAYHSDVDRFQRDRARQNDLTLLGWTVLRFTWADLTQRPGAVAAAVQAILET